MQQGDCSLLLSKKPRVPEVSCKQNENVTLTNLGQVLFSIKISSITFNFDRKPSTFKLSFHKIEVWVHSKRDVLSVSSTGWQLFCHSTLERKPGCRVRWFFIRFAWLVDYNQEMRIEICWVCANVAVTFLLCFWKNKENYKNAYLHLSESGYLWIWIFRISKLNKQTDKIKTRSDILH